MSAPVVRPTVADCVAVSAHANPDPVGPGLTHPVVRGHLDLTRPTAVLMVALLHFLDDQEDPAGVVAAFRDALAPGSYVVISQVADLPDSPPDGLVGGLVDGLVGGLVGGLVDGPDRVLATRQAARLYQELAAPRFTVRSREQIAALFDGLVLVESGLVTVPEWCPPRARPQPCRARRDRARVLPVLGGVGRLPLAGDAW